MSTILLELPMDALALPAASPEELAREATHVGAETV